MELAVVLSAGLEDWIDFGVIIGILCGNAAVGWYQEKQAADVVASLKGDIALKVSAVRDGKEQEVLARELVPGDVVCYNEALHCQRFLFFNAPADTLRQIVVSEGHVVAADAQVICDYNNANGWEEFKAMRERGELGESSAGEEGEGGGIGEEDDEKGDKEDEDQKQGHPVLACDHSAITGESLAVDRYMGDLVYYTTGCKRGKAYAVAQTSAKYSFVGRTATMIQSTEAAGHFEKVMDSFGMSLLVLTMAWILAAWIGGFFRGLPIAEPRQQTLLHYTLSLLIAGVPVGLPVVTTTTMAVGAAYLAKKKAIVQKLTAIESLSVSSTSTNWKTSN